MDSKEILETFGISKNFGIVLFIQSIIVIIGCFLALQSMYVASTSGRIMLILDDGIKLLLFLVLIYYSFIGFKKDESHFKIAVYLFIISVLFSIISIIPRILTLGISRYMSIFGIVIVFILACYFVYNLGNYNKAKITILLIVLIEVITWIAMNIISGSAIEYVIISMVSVIPAVSIALTYFARYNDKGFKILL